jgi:hypothetical protein
MAFLQILNQRLQRVLYNPPLLDCHLLDKLMCFAAKLLRDAP